MDSDQRRSTSSARRFSERRERPRVAPVVPVIARTDFGQQFSVMNVSTGGALLHGPFELALGDVHDLQFILPDAASSILLAARVVYVIRVATANGPSFTTGVEFLHHAPEAVERLMLAATSTA